MSFPQGRVPGQLTEWRRVDRGWGGADRRHLTQTSGPHSAPPVSCPFEGNLPKALPAGFYTVIPGFTLGLLARFLA